ncbi:hypothetical protein FD19_GL000280 [Lacticaseibacillus thailandensis DSM 22698 = JCM 13996]|uniref:Uncharacterized protein n=1 Tax=Lacticaseibacillus thailandensis DSM 22698 = JCM 13996 TaxID=1423810 RepID=A0A0R2C873_9LACO|nr:hypothetical protein FD19_GL000280 [Lacticaseibacillus thailandensis DSM 22698 = JCM 13996]
MSTLGLVIIVAVLIIAGGWWWARRRRLRIQHEHAQWMRAINLGVGKALHDAGLAVGLKVTGQPVEEVWHRQVMLAHFTLPVGSGVTVAQVQAAFSGAHLAQLALTDCFVQAEDQQLNFDVAYLVNDATKAYVADLARVE